MYEEKWAAYRRIRTLRYGFLFGFVPVVGGLSWLHSRLFGEGGNFVGIVVSCWVAIWLYFTFRHIFLRCPRCGEFWGLSRPLGWLKESCPACGLKKFSMEP